MPLWRKRPASAVKSMASRIKTYSELIRISTFDERLEYLREYSNVGEDTFGFRRYLNQTFYRTYEWRQIRKLVILRDNGLDLGLNPVPPSAKLIIHHMKPLAMDDIENKTQYLTDPEFLITTTLETHNAIHYGRKSELPPVLEERTPGDTCIWRTR